jgi:hypothetical protein
MGAELAEQDHVERSVESERHLIGHRHTTPGQSNDHDIVVSKVPQVSG